MTSSIEYEEKQKEEESPASPKYTTAGLKKVDIAAVEKKSPLPREFSQAQRRLSKIDITAVENKFKSRPPLNNHVGSTYTKVKLKKVSRKAKTEDEEMQEHLDEKSTDAFTSPLPSEFAQTKRRLSKIDVSLVENKYKNKLPLPLDDVQEQESKPPTVALKKVDIAAVENKQKTRPAPPMELSREFSVKRLSRVDIAAVENKSKESPHESSQVPAYTTAGLKKVDIQSVERKARPPPMALPTEMSSRSLSLRKVNKNKSLKRESIPDEGKEESNTFLSRASLKKVDIQQVEKNSYKGEGSKLQTFTLKKVKDKSDKKPPAMLPAEFSSKRLSHTEPTSPKQHLEKESPKLSLEFSPDHLQHKVNIQDVEKRAKKERELAGPAMLPAEFSPKLLSRTENTKPLVSPSVLPKEITTRRSQILHLPDLQSLQSGIDYDEEQEVLALPQRAIE